MPAVCGVTVAEFLSEMEARDKPMSRGDYEFVEGPDGMSHTLVCTRRGDSLAPRHGVDRSYEFMCMCDVFKSGIKTSEIHLAKTLNCIKCMLANFKT